MFWYSDPANWDEIEKTIEVECRHCMWEGELDVYIGCRPNTDEGVYTFVCPQCGKDDEGEIDL